jgi:hypothetical protein
MHFDDIRTVMDRIAQSSEIDYKTFMQVQINASKRECPEINPHTSEPFSLKEVKNDNVMTNYFKKAKT